MRGGQAHDRVNDLVPGALVLFCPACPQLGINIPPENEWKENERCVDMQIQLLEYSNDLCSWLYQPQLVVDGNMHLVHVWNKCADDNISLSDGICVYGGAGSIHMPHSMCSRQTTSLFIVKYYQCYIPDITFRNHGAVIIVFRTMVACTGNI
jgi:hypothetical protein